MLNISFSSIRPEKNDSDWGLQDLLLFFPAYFYAKTWWTLQILEIFISSFIINQLRFAFILQVLVVILPPVTWATFFHIFINVNCLMLRFPRILLTTDLFSFFSNICLILWVSNSTAWIEQPLETPSINQSIPLILLLFLD